MDYFAKHSKRSNNALLGFSQLKNIRLKFFSERMAEQFLIHFSGQYNWCYVPCHHGKLLVKVLYGGLFYRD